MGTFLVTGNPGSGKTAIADELRRRGQVAVDADQFAGWHCATGAEVEEPADADDAWRLGYRWRWRRGAVETFLARQRPAADVFVCGIAMNQRELLHLFDGVFLLSLDHATQVDRLDRPSNAGRTPAQRLEILEGREVFEREAVEAGAVVLDGRRPTATLADDLLHRAGAGSRPAQPSLQSQESRHVGGDGTAPGLREPQG